MVPASAHRSAKASILSISGRTSNSLPTTFSWVCPWQPTRRCHIFGHLGCLPILSVMLPVNPLP